MMFIVQNWGQHPQYTYKVDNTKSMKSTHVALYVCHDNKLWHLRDAKRVKSKLWEYQPPVVAFPPTDPLVEPSESYVSNESGFPARFEVLSLLLLPPPHLRSSSDDVMESHLVIKNLHLHHIHV
jgi:hypothetical protein